MNESLWKKKESYLNKLFYILKIAGLYSNYFLFLLKNASNTNLFIIIHNNYNK